MGMVSECSRRQTSDSSQSPRGYARARASHMRSPARRKSVRRFRARKLERACRCSRVLTRVHAQTCECLAIPRVFAIPRVRVRFRARACAHVPVGEHGRKCACLRLSVRKKAQACVCVCEGTRAYAVVCTSVPMLSRAHACPCVTLRALSGPHP
eukprot:5083664-Pleurochrysis_carterae.AAC.1